MDQPNIYENLEIKDYSSVYIFLEDIDSRAELIVDDTLIMYDGFDITDCLVIYGGRDFIMQCIIFLYSDKFCYQVESINIEDDDLLYQMVICYDKIRGYIMSVSSVDIFSNGKYKIVSGKYIRSFLNQDDVDQEIVNTCLNNYDEVMLFGIDSLDCVNCPWHDECDG